MILCFGASGAEAQQLRYEGTHPGGIVVTGNSLGLSKATNDNGPGTRDSIGTFIALGPSAIDTVPVATGVPWFMPTTNSWMDNASSATLSLPAGARVLYAELVWGGSTNYGGEDVTASLDAAVTLSVGGAAKTVSPTPATALTIGEMAFAGFAANYYSRSAEVTEFVSTHGAGSYRLAGVPATQETATNSLNAAGWSLAVVYELESEPVRHVSLLVGGSFVDEDNEQDYSVSGFCTPGAGEVEAKVVVSAIEGDANLAGDQLQISDGAASFSLLSGPNNPGDNIFASQINGNDGQVDTLGTFGARNHDATNGINSSGARQGWDVTTLTVRSVDGQLANGQQTAVVRASTADDTFVPTLVGFALELDAPQLSTMLQTDVTPPVGPADTFKVTVSIDNLGANAADNLVLRMPLDPSLALLGASFNGADLPGISAADFTSGLVLGSIPAMQLLNKLELALQVVAPPSGNDYVFAMEWSYDFQSCSIVTTAASHRGGELLVAYAGGVADAGVSTTDAGVADASLTDASTVADAATGADAVAADAAAMNDDAGMNGGDGDGGGCGCRQSGAPPGWLLGFLILLFWSRRGSAKPRNARLPSPRR